MLRKEEIVVGFQTPSIIVFAIATFKHKLTERIRDWLSLKCVLHNTFALLFHWHCRSMNDWLCTIPFLCFQNRRQMFVSINLSSNVCAINSSIYITVAAAIPKANKFVRFFTTQKHKKEFAIQFSVYWQRAAEYPSIRRSWQIHNDRDSISLSKWK